MPPIMLFPENLDGNSNVQIKAKVWRSSLAVALLAFILYLLTAFRSINWWDSSEYSLAATSLGVPHAPGLLLPVILGWFVTKIPLALSPAFKLNIFAALTSAFAACIILTVVHSINKLARPLDGKIISWAMAGAAIGVLTFSFLSTIWQYSTQFTPYIFTAFMTVAILWALLNWWQSADTETSHGWLFVVTLLMGLDFSVHRTNVLLWPALPIWIVLRNHRALLSVKTWITVIAGLALGLGFHLLLIPIAASKPFMNLGDPGNFTRFWDYISLKQYGGGWLINIFPRNAGFWNVQALDYLKAFAANFFLIRSSFGAIGILPALAGIIGIIALWRKSWRLACAMTVLFLFASIGAVIYFNLPENYFRPIDRHYIPSFVIFGALMAFGMGIVMARIRAAFSDHLPASIFAFVLVAILPGYQVLHNYHQLDSSRNHFAHDFAKNMLSTLPENSILFTNGDNDTYPLWYLQGAEGFRTDVTVANISLLNTSWFVAQLISRDSNFPLRLSKNEVADLAARPWNDTTITIPVHREAAILSTANETQLPDSLAIHVVPTYAEKYLLPQDWLMLQILINNDWKRPIYFASTVSPQNITWIEQNLSFEGLAKQVLPLAFPQIDDDILRRNLEHSYSFRGYNAKNVDIDETSRKMATNYYVCALQLALAYANKNEIDGCKKTIDFIYKALPPARLGPMPPQLMQAFETVCAGDSIH